MRNRKKYNREREREREREKERERDHCNFFGNYSVNMANARCASYKYSYVSNNCVSSKGNFSTSFLFFDDFKNSGKLDKDISFV